jgi:hypothetical protein
LEQVLSPTNVCNGQKLTRLVSTNTPAGANSTIPGVPEMTCPKYKPAITPGMTNLSTVPMFFFKSAYFAQPLMSRTMDVTKSTHVFLTTPGLIYF